MSPYNYTVIETVVRGLEAVWENARVLVWHVVEHEPKLIMTSYSRTCDMEAALAVWNTKWRALESGTVIHHARAVYHPVTTADNMFVGFLQGVDGTCGVPDGPELANYVQTRLRALAVALAQAPALAVGAAGEPHGSAVVTLLATADREETERSKTVTALVRSGWNAALAGRILGITRQSVCRRMVRMAITRPEPSPFDSRRRRLDDAPAET